MIDVGFKNYLDSRHVIHILPPNTARAKWLIKEATAGRYLIDCTQGHKTESLLICQTGHLILSGLKESAINKRIKYFKENGGQIFEEIESF